MAYMIIYFEFEIDEMIMYHIFRYLEKFFYVEWSLDVSFDLH